MSYTTKDAVKMAMDGDAAKFQEAISDLLMDKVRDAVSLKKIEVASNFMTSDIEEEVEIEEEETLSEAIYSEHGASESKQHHQREAERHERFAVAAKQHGDSATYKKEMNAAKYHKQAADAHEKARNVHRSSPYSLHRDGGMGGSTGHDEVVKAHQDAHAASKKAGEATENSVKHYDDNHQKYKDDYKKKINQVASAPAHHMDYHRGYDPESGTYHKDHEWAREGKPVPKED